MTLARNTEAKEVDLGWIDVIPSRWEVRRAKTLFQRMDRQPRSDDDVVTCFRDGVVTLRKNRRTTGFTESLKEIGYQGIRKGDLVIHAMDAFAGAIGVSDSDGKGTPVYAVCRPLPGVNAYFYAAMLREMSRSGYLLSLAKGIRERSTDFRYADFASQFVPLPPAGEQEAIVRFIRHIDYRVNKLIKAKRRLIELLNEQKQVIIHQAVTKGLDPNVPMKDSGIEWLGQIPEHWDNWHLARHLRSIEQGWSPRAAEGELLDSQWAVLTLSAVKNGHFNRLALKPIDRDATVPVRYEVNDGDLLITRSNTRLLVGDVCCVENARPKTIISDLIYRLGLRDSLVPRFAMYFLLSYPGRLQIERDARGSSGTMPKISQQHIHDWRIPRPGVPEQLEIVRAIESATCDLERALSKAQSEIDLIREYRARLVADVVTGQLDVRHLDLPEVDEIPEDIDLDTDLEEDEAEETEAVEE